MDVLVEQVEQHFIRVLSKCPGKLKQTPVSISYTVSLSLSQSLYLSISFSYVCVSVCVCDF